MNKIQALREAGQVRRCHTLPHHGCYDVAQHSWNALGLLFYLHPSPSRALIFALLFHDAAERFCGDQPAQVGWARPELRKMQKAFEASVLQKMGLDFPLDPDELLWLDALDKLELLLWCHDQEALGNRNVENCRKLLLNWFRENMIPGPIHDFIHTYQWERCNELV